MRYVSNCILLFVNGRVGLLTNMTVRERFVPDGETVNGRVGLLTNMTVRERFLPDGETVNGHFSLFTLFTVCRSISIRASRSALT